MIKLVQDELSLRRIYLERIFVTLTLVLLLLTPTIKLQAASNPELNGLDVKQLADNTVIIQLNFNAKITTPVSFSTDNPPRLVLDFKEISNKLKANEMRREVKLGAVKELAVVESGNRTRVVINLENLVQYTIENIDNSLLLKFKPQGYKDKKINTFSAKNSEAIADYSIKDIDFRRGSDFAGRFIVDLSAANVPVDVIEEGDTVTVNFVGAKLPSKFARKLDVSDFGTPVQMIEIRQVGSNVEAKIRNNGYFENIAYQADNRFTIEVKPLTESQKFSKQSKDKQYVGDKLSLNFQDIEIRAVLQLISDFTGINMVASDSVQGKLTLRLQNVPWDQALDLILKSKGLDRRQIGNVMMIGPAKEIADREKLELESSQQVKDLAPLKTEFVQINYAKAATMAGLLKDKANSLLSSRGTVSVDERTNTLLIQDTVDKLTEVRKVIKNLDIPVRQVLIESRIVIASDDFERALGIDFGLSSRAGNKPGFGFSGTRASASAVALGASPSTTSATDRLNVSLPAGFSDGSATSNFALAVAEIAGNTILDLELTALESEGLGTIVSSPRLITSNQNKAYIESGEEIPFQEASSSGATTTSFKKAVIRLEVVPQITPDDKIILDLTVNQDAKGAVLASGEFAIDTREIKTQVLVDNGKTIVLGGIYQQTKSNNATRIPFLGSMPVLGWLFRSNQKVDKRSELLIFVTPKIIKEDFNA